MPQVSAIRAGATITEGETLLDLEITEPATIKSVGVVNCGPSYVRYLGAKVAGPLRESVFVDEILPGFPPVNGDREFGMVRPAAGAEVSPDDPRNPNAMRGVELLIGYQLPTDLEQLPRVLLARSYVIVHYVVDGHEHTQAIGTRFVICNPSNATDAQCSTSMLRMFPSD